MDGIAIGIEGETNDIKRESSTGNSNFALFGAEGLFHIIIKTGEDEEVSLSRIFLNYPHQGYTLDEGESSIFLSIEEIFDYLKNGHLYLLGHIIEATALQKAKPR